MSTWYFAEVVRYIAAKEFIYACLKPDRPTARELLQHPFLVATEGIDEEVLTGTWRLHVFV